MIRPGAVVADVSFRHGLEREGEGYGEIFGAVAVVNQTESQRAGPTPHVAIDRVKLFLQTAVSGVEVVCDARAPVVIHPVKHGAGDEVVAVAQKSVVQIPVADAPTPLFVG